MGFALSFFDTPWPVLQTLTRRHLPVISESIQVEVCRMSYVLRVAARAGAAAFTGSAVTQKKHLSQRFWSFPVIGHDFHIHPPIVERTGVEPVSFGLSCQLDDLSIWGSSPHVILMPGILRGRNCAGAHDGDRTRPSCLGSRRPAAGPHGHGCRSFPAVRL